MDKRVCVVALPLSYVGTFKGLEFDIDTWIFPGIQLSTKSLERYLQSTAYVRHDIHSLCLISIFILSGFKELRKETEL